jgi:tetraacyldisaccharide 4'-kinase
VSILDDGFQHVQLERDIDLLLVSMTDLQERVLPSGHLREPLDAARFADALLVTGTEEDVAHVAGALGHSRAFQVVPKYADLKGPRRLDEGPRRDGGQRVLAFAGIARPERFFNALRSLGYDIARELTFRDHHWYTAADLDAIQRAARDANASLIVTTEKDAVRCDLDVAVLPMTVQIEPAAEFESWLMGRLKA